MTLEDLAAATTVGVRLTSNQLAAVIDVLDDHLATCPSPLSLPSRSVRAGERLRIMYVEHARGRLAAALNQHRAGTPSTADAHE